MYRILQLRGKRFLLYSVVLAVILAAACRNPSGPPPPNTGDPARDEVVSQLTNSIKSAQTLLSDLNKLPEDGSVLYGDTYWISADQKKALADAIAEAQKNAEDPSLTPDELKDALDVLDAICNTAENAKQPGNKTANKTALLDKINEAKTEMTGVKTSTDGNNIPKYETWITQTELAGLQDAIKAAETLSKDVYARQEAVDAEVQKLADVINSFIPQEGKQPADALKLDALNAIITEAETLLSELKALQESVDGSDVYKDTLWISAARKKALEDAIAQAQKSADNEYIRPEQIDEAGTALAAAFDTAKEAKKLGTFTANKTELQKQIDAANAKNAGVIIISSNNGLDVKYPNNWVTEAMMTSLNAALAKAQTLNGDDLARQDDVNAAATNLAAAVAAFNKQEGRLIPGSVDRYTFEGPKDETITLPENKVLSWADDTLLTVTVDEAFDSYQWYVDGEIKPGATVNSITLNAKSFSVGTHTLTLKVKKDGVPYTKTLTFKVN